MSITKLTTNGVNGSKYDTVSADNYYMEPIATTLLGSSQATITFSNIPQTYKHLQIRMFAQTNRATVGRDGVNMQFNGDTSTSYASHGIYGDGSSATAEANTPSLTAITIRNIGTSTTGSAYFGAIIVDILDYQNNNKFKTLRFLGGVDVNGTVGGAGGTANFGSGVYLNTSAVTSIQFVPAAGTTFSANSRFSLFGIKG